MALNIILADLPAGQYSLIIDIVLAVGLVACLCYCLILKSGFRKQQDEIYRLSKKLKELSDMQWPGRDLPTPRKPKSGAASSATRTEPAAPASTTKAAPAAPTAARPSTSEFPTVDLSDIDGTSVPTPPQAARPAPSAPAKPDRKPKGAASRPQSTPMKCVRKFCMFELDDAENRISVRNRDIEDEPGDNWFELDIMPDRNTATYTIVRDSMPKLISDIMTFRYFCEDFVCESPVPTTIEVIEPGELTQMEKGWLVTKRIKVRVH